MANGVDMFTEEQWNQIGKALSLSRREAQIIKELFADSSDKKIALDLKIKIPTVRTHISRLFRKLNADCRQDLILHVFHCFLQSCRKIGCPRLR